MRKAYFFTADMFLYLRTTDIEKDYFMLIIKCESHC